MQCNVHHIVQSAMHKARVTQDAAQCAPLLHRGIRPRQLFTPGALFSDFAGNLFLRRALIRHLFMLLLGCMGSGGNFARGGGRSGDKGGQRKRQPMSGRLGPKKENFAQIDKEETFTDIHKCYILALGIL